MRVIKTSGLSAAATIVLGLLLQGCATPTSDAMKDRQAAEICEPGEILACDTSSSGRISDGRYGHNRGRNGRRKNCGCVPERDLAAIAGRGLPAPREIN